MTVSELIEELQAVDQTLPVYCYESGQIDKIRVFLNYTTRKAAGIALEVED